MTEGTADNEQEKIKQAIDLLKETYYDSSEIAKIINTRNAGAEEEDFLQLGSKFYIPKEWFTRNDIIYDIAIRQFAENLVMSETKYLLSRVFGCTEIQTVAAEPDVLKGFLKNYKSFSERYKIQAIFAPIDLYVKMHVDWPVASADVKLDFRSGELIVYDEKPKFFWSNNYTPFSQFIFVNKGFGQWTTKPDFDNRLSVSITPSDKEDKLTLLFLTKFKFEITNPDKIRILSRNE